MKLFTLFSLFLSTSVSAENVFDLSLEDLLNVKVEVSSLKVEDEDEIIGSVHKVEKSWWNLSGETRGFDALRGIEGIEVHDNLGGVQGVSFRGFSGSTTSVRGIATLFDGIPINDISFGTGLYSKSFLPLDILKKVEVAKGPMSILYGPDAFHGAISLIPENYDRSKNYFSIGHGNFGNFKSNLVKNYKVNNLKLTSNISFISQEDADINDEMVSKNRDEGYDSLAIYQALKFKNTKLGFLFNNAGSSEMLNISSNEKAFSGVNKIENTLVYLKNEYRVGSDYLLKSTAWYHDTFVELNFETSSKIFSSWRDKKVGAKLHLIDDSKRDGNRFDFGLEYYRDWSSGAESQVNGSHPSKTGYHRIHRVTTGAFGNYTYKFNGLKASAGVRFDHFSNTEDLNISPKVGAVYKINPNNTLKISASRGFRLPVGGELAGTSTINGNSSLKSEKLNTYEVGYLLTNNSFRVSTSIFSTKWTDAIIGSGSPSTFNNAGELRSNGIEASLRYAWKGRSLLFVNGHYIRSKSNDTGLEFTSFPRYVVNWGYKYKKRSLELLFENRHKFEVTATPSSASKKLPDFFSTNLGLKYNKNKRIHYSLNIRNLFNIKNKNTALWGVSNGGEDERFNILGKVTLVL